MGTLVDAVKLSPNANVIEFRDAVKIKYADSHLKGVAPSNLLVYKNQKALEEKIPLNPTLSLDLLEIKETLIVVVPRTIGTFAGMFINY